MELLFPGRQCGQAVINDDFVIRTQNCWRRTVRLWLWLRRGLTRRRGFPLCCDGAFAGLFGLCPAANVSAGLMLVSFHE